MAAVALSADEKTFLDAADAVMENILLEGATRSGVQVIAPILGYDKLPTSTKDLAKAMFRALFVATLRSGWTP